MPGTLELAQAIIENRRPEYLVTANLNYLMLTNQHPRLEEINRDAAAIIADGQPIVRRSRRGEGLELPERVAGSDLIVELAKLSSRQGYSIYFLGAAPGVAQAAADQLVTEFPGLKIAGVQSPPFRQLTAAEHQAMVADIHESGADILLVAFGQPKGECWIYDNLHDLNVPLCIQLGASFDFLAGTAKRAPRFWQRIGCEWLYRALSDPWRLVPRYGMNILFLASLLAGDFIARKKRAD
ncbi:MAG TPA: glycosyltransferase [Planctomycetaceae bacterium]|nr:glycosyltransferase [Planctomycetaceae bacterium]